MEKIATINTRIKKADYDYISGLAKKQGRTFMSLVSELVNIHKEVDKGIMDW